MNIKIHDNPIAINLPNWKHKAINELNEKGVVVLRGVETEVNLDIINENASRVLKTPSLLGAEGYYQKDPFKQMFDGFLLSNKVVEMVANENILNLIGDYVGDEIILNEIFLKHDLGSNLSYFPYHRHTGVDVEGDIDKPFGCGCMIYLHDTNEGAFCYSLYSHKLSIERGKESLLSNHNSKNNLQNNLRKIIGKKGDVVIFDERGFHGPEQPCNISRKVLLFGYQAVKSTLKRSRTGVPVVISFLKKLNSRQLRAIGVGGGSRVNYSDYHIRTGVLKSKNYKLLSLITNFLFDIELFFIRLKLKIKNIN